jgi:hypothetical protein
MPPPPQFRPPVPLMERVLSGRLSSPTPEDQESIKLGGRIVRHIGEGLADIPRNLVHLSSLDERSVPEDFPGRPHEWPEALRRARAEAGTNAALLTLGFKRLPSAPRNPLGVPGGPPVPPGMVVGPGGKLMRLEDIPTTFGEGNGRIYKAGDASPSNLSPRPGERYISFRRELSEPLPQGDRPIFHKREYRAYDPKQLEPGSVTYDIHPDGHVSVEPPPVNSIEDLKGAVVGKKGIMPRK